MIESDIISLPESVDSKIQDQNIREVLKDYKICCISREASMLARREVLTGKAKFGIVGDGKEVPQVAMARAFKNGDWRAGYYRDQTFMFALGLCTVEAFFAQLYADAEGDPFSKGRQMNSHYATPFTDDQGNWLSLKDSKNISSDISCTAGQMGRAVGLALASKQFRSNSLLENTKFSTNGNEICFCTIGDASTSEGAFWESVNAVGVQKIPLFINVWDDGYGISVPIEYQTTKGSISEVLSGFAVNEKGQGLTIKTVKAWDYPALCTVYQEMAASMRETHIPALLHVQEVTQPQGHSTSGSHERYKSKERLQFEKDFDCITKMRAWMLETGLATEAQLEEIEKSAKKEVRAAKKRAWDNYNEPIQGILKVVVALYDKLAQTTAYATEVLAERQALAKYINPVYHNIVQSIKKVFRTIKTEQSETRVELAEILRSLMEKGEKDYHTFLYDESPKSALDVPAVPAVFSEDSPKLNGYQILNKFFELTFNKYPNVYAFGEDVGQIGDVNQGFAGLQEKFGEDRIFDAGIREWTIAGQAIGMAMRGLRPIAEMQYLDYLAYAFSPLTDDLASLHYRSGGQQIAPAIIRTRGHRLEGIWHSGSPMGVLVNSMRGICVCVPRNMTQAAGMYNTMLQSNDPAIVIECLNGYRLKEVLPDNLAEFTVPLGVPEVLEEGTDVTLVTYGSCVRIAQAAMEQLEEVNISVELIDIQTLLPFDLEGRIVQSLQKTNRIVFLDEDVPAGGTAYMMRQVLEVQDGYKYLDSKPTTIAAAESRPPYGSDGDYFTKPNAEQVFETIYNIMNEAEPAKYPKLYF